MRNAEAGPAARGAALVPERLVPGALPRIVAAITPCWTRTLCSTQVCGQRARCVAVDGPGRQWRQAA
jgi:hypothetical protein